MDVLTPIVLGTVSVLGVFGHSLTLFMLHRLKTMLNKTLDATTQRLMVSQAACDLMLFGIGLPLAIWNQSSGNVWPFTLPGVCYYRRVLQFGLSQVSEWHLAVMAALRFAAVFMPNTHAQMLAKTRTSLVIVLCSFYRCRFDPISGLCDIGPAEPTEASSQKLKAFLAADGLFDTMIPTASALVMYTAVLIKLQLRKRKQIGNFGNAVAATTSNKNNNNALHRITADKTPVSQAPNVSLAPSASKQPNSLVNKKAVTASRLTNAARRFDAVKIVAISCFANIALLYPKMFAFMSGSMLVINFEYPLVGLLLDAWHFGAFCVTPLVYATSSRDMRMVYKKLIKQLLVSCWSKKQIPQPLPQTFSLKVATNAAGVAK